MYRGQNKTSLRRIHHRSIGSANGCAGSCSGNISGYGIGRRTVGLGPCQRLFLGLRRQLRQQVSRDKDGKQHPRRFQQEQREDTRLPPKFHHDQNKESMRLVSHLCWWGFQRIYKVRLKNVPRALEYCNGRREGRREGNCAGQTGEAATC